MIINNAPANEAILSNVSEIGEFRIRNSAKAFNILSSGLYANKIRAVIRELSCNAVDSHAASGNKETPFDVHLPNQLEPWFAIRDYGTGLSHDQVTNIYTTYFESTKTASNEFIGALGLGSKSPFSYTDNFTVTAIKDGVKGVYSAFINESGVPSIAKMGEEATVEPAGVEVKFSVNDRWDFDKFRQEARVVYTYFKLRPVVTGVNGFAFDNVTYETENIIPGVHACQNTRGSKAVMGNIAYPIDVPNAEQNLGELSGLLHCGLEMHFAIGELDFQASREGLSYIPQTVDSIKSKLEAVNAQLAIHIATEADAIENMWERTQFLLKKRENRLWTAAVTKYVTDTEFPLLNRSNPTSYDYLRATKMSFETKKLAKRYNIEIRAFGKSRGTSTCTVVKPSQEFSDKRGAGGHYHTWQVWNFYASHAVTFVKNNTKTGALERAKYHFRNTKPAANEAYSREVYVLDVADKTKPAQFDAFLKAIYNPPSVMWAEDLLKKERAGSAGQGKNVTIMRMEERGGSGYHRSKEMVWRDAGSADMFDTAKTHYYLPLSGFNILTKGSYTIDAKVFVGDLRECGFSELNQLKIYGVRKGDIEFIKLQKNWINIEDHVTAVLSRVTDADKMRLAFKAVDKFRFLHYNRNIASLVENTDSPFLKQTIQFMDIKSIEYSKYSLNRLCSRYASSISVDTIEQTLVDECTAIYSRYPLFSSLETYRAVDDAVAEYINLIDAKKGV